MINLIWWLLILTVYGISMYRNGEANGYMKGYNEALKERSKLYEKDN